VQRFLHKPSQAIMAAQGALWTSDDRSGAHVYTDSLFWTDWPTAHLLLSVRERSRTRGVPTPHSRDLTSRLYLWVPLCVCVCVYVCVRARVPVYVCVCVCVCLVVLMHVGLCLQCAPVSHCLALFLSLCVYLWVLQCYRTQMSAHLPGEIDAYGDMLQALGTHADPAYIDKSPSPGATSHTHTHTHTHTHILAERTQLGPA
jgi:hypothetical protein